MTPPHGGAFYYFCTKQSLHAMVPCDIPKSKQINKHLEALNLVPQKGSSGEEKEAGSTSKDE